MYMYMYMHMYNCIFRNHIQWADISELHDLNFRRGGPVHPSF